MSAVFEEIVEQERARSFTEGELKGRKEGRSEGLEQGLKEGEADGRKDVAKSLIASGMSPSEVAKHTKLSVNEVDYLRKSMAL